MKFTHLHTHSHYSLLDGLVKIDDLIEKTKEYNMDSVALTDHGVMYGAIEFYQKALKAGVKPIVGVEAYLAAGSRFEKTRQGRYHLVLLAKNKTGYGNLLKLTSLAHLEGYYYKPRIDWEILEKYSEGLVALSACIQGEVPRAFLTSGHDKAKEITKKYLKLFGHDFYLEVQKHNNVEGQDKANQGLIQIGKELGIPIVATNDAHYLDVEDEEAQDVLLCLQTKKKQKDTDRMNMIGMDNSFKSTEKMKESFYDFKEAVSNTEEVVKKCNLEIELGKITLPKFEVPKEKTDSEYLRDLCNEGAKKRYPEYFKEDGEKFDDPDNFKKQVLDRLDFEFNVIDKMGFASYFLIVGDFVNWAKEQKIVVGPGRGSAAGSLVAYLLSITNVDPLKYDLMFERFLNPDRISMPDIDLDFADTRRDEVIRYVEKKYGRDKVAQIITFGTMAARAAIRDAGRVLDFEYDYCDKLAKMIPMFTPLQKAIDEVGELNAIYNNEVQAKKILDTALKLEGVARHASTHACAVLITKDPLDKSVPLQYASSGDKTIVSQFSMKPVEELGLLKMDFLGLRNLTIIENALRIIKGLRDIEINIDNIPLDDQKTYELFSKGDTTGVFQFESSGMRRYLKLLQPSVFEDIIAMVALYRPGPLNSGMIDEFIDRKHGRKQIVFKHQIMENALKNSYGVIVYQEQVMQLSKDMAGFTGGQADTLRKAMGKKIAALMAKMKSEFIEGCVKKGLEENLARDTFRDMEKFAEYGFNRSHAACYGLIGYQTAYLKANYPVEFMAALLTANEGDVDKVAIDVAECQKIGIEVLPPDINESFEHFTVVPLKEGDDKKFGQIRFGLLTVKNVGENIVTEIIKERKKNGKFLNLGDFISRIKSKDFNKKSLESLMKCGALDNIGDRSKLLFNLEKILVFIRSLRDQEKSKQGNLLGMLSDDYKPTLELDEIEEGKEISKKEKLSWEKELLGLYVSDHPFTKFQADLADKTVSLLEANKETENFKEKQIIIAGIISKIKKITTKKGDAMMFVTIEDTASNLEILVFPRLLEETKDLWEEEKMLIVKGKLSDKDGVPKLLAESVKELVPSRIDETISVLNQARDNKSYYKKKQENNNNFQTNNNSRFIDIKMPKIISKEKLVKLKEFFSKYSGETKVRFIIENGVGAKIINTSFNVPSSNLEEIKSKVDSIILN
ncbi:DNA polymerase III subunit alpha [Candidatus Falkowbacteria bacterium]|jgi:DNA polymerase III subunit alpha|nr:DNA polymerase III subunit alpha [Candidatus Falkowbacteria bacterium]MBT4433332.1 DNA polymerase III subunit alpha [Candidatus Falkowbacteria bacterium]